MTLSRTSRLALASGVAFFALSTAALAQSTVADTSANTADNQAATDGGKEILVTGSRIKIDPTKSAAPLEVITPDVIERNGISSPEQLNMYLTSSGSGADNLAANADVTTGAQRGTNGLSSANLRGQGSASTLVLLNGRRVAAHGLSGGAVDVNQIPFAAIERVEVLKDGASAIYGTDAVGGVINYITRKDYKGIGMTATTDVTEHGGGNIYSLSGIAGYGDLKSQGFNVMFAAQYRWNEILRGSDRDFVNGNQPNRGLSIDTRGTPIATVFGVGDTRATSTLQFPSLLNRPGSNTNITLTAPNGGNAASGGINILNLPGGAGCASMDGGMAYDYALWSAPNNYYACAWDTGRAAVIQQPIKTLTYYGRGTVALGSSELYVEGTGSQAKSSKIFSHNQLSTSTTSLPIFYPLNALTATTYNQVYNAILGAFTNPTERAALQANYGKPIAFRYRCIPCGPREYATDAKTWRIAGGVDGPLPMTGWDYRAGLSYAQSDVSSTLGSGYYYRGTLASAGTVADPAAPTAPGATAPGLVGLINAGILNPFSIEQTPAAIAGLAAISAEGTTLYGGRYKTLQADTSVSGPLFRLPGGDAQIALGIDYRRETYEFNGSAAAAASAPVIFNAAFDNANALLPKSRTVKAAYAEVSLPLFDALTVTGALRHDDYSGFGGTTNPRVTARFAPVDFFALRGSYSTAFRVPSFNQIFNGVTDSPYAGSDLADPVKCPGGVPTSAFGSGQPCAAIRPDIRTGGNIALGPETAKMYSIGAVLTPAPRWSLSADYWSIKAENTLLLPTLRQLIDNASFFPERFIKDASGNITLIDDRWLNAGKRTTRGIEIALRGGFAMGRGSINLGADATYMLQKDEQVVPSAPIDHQLGKFTYAGDLGLRWKHNAWIGYSDDTWSATLTQIFRGTYANQKLPGIANGTVTRPDFNEKVSPYSIFNLSVSYLALRPNFKITGGIKNILDTDPPFAITYDGNTGAGSSWEPRVADPRGRAFTLQVEVKY